MSRVPKKLLVYTYAIGCGGIITNCHGQRKASSCKRLPPLIEHHFRFPLPRVSHLSRKTRDLNRVAKRRIAFIQRKKKEHLKMLHRQEKHKSSPPESYACRNRSCPHMAAQDFAAVSMSASALRPLSFLLCGFYFILPEQSPLHVTGEEASINLHRTTFDTAVHATAESHSHSHATHTVVQRVGLGPIGIGKGLEEECFGSRCAIVIGGGCRGGTGLCVGRSWERGEEGHVLPVLLLIC